MTPTATSDQTPKPDGRLNRAAKGLTQFPMTAERKARYVEGLRLSASHRWAAKYATPNGNENTSGDHRQITYAYSSFLRERKVDPEFSAACDEALAQALGKLERSLMRRAFKPDVREQFDPKSGACIGRSEGWEPANRLARALLARHLPEYVDQQKRQVESTVTVVGSNGQGGIGFTITPQLTEFLNDDEKRQLSDLMRTMMTRADEQKRIANAERNNKLEDQR